MPSCRACRDPRRDQIDQKLLAGVPLRTICASTGLSLGGLVRHKTHVKEMLGLALEERSQEEGAAHGSDLLQRVEVMINEAQEILTMAKSSKSLAAATGAVNAITRLLELTGRLDGSLAQPHAPGLHMTFNRNTTIHVTNHDSDDAELALLIGEATKDFSIEEFLRLKAIATAPERFAEMSPSGRRQLPGSGSV